MLSVECGVWSVGGRGPPGSKVGEGRAIRAPYFLRRGRRVLEKFSHVLATIRMKKLHASRVGEEFAYICCYPRDGSCVMVILPTQPANKRFPFHFRPNFR